MSRRTARFSEPHSADGAGASPPTKTAPSSIRSGLYTLDLLAPHQKYYLPDGTQVPGVTTVLGATLPKQALIDWAWRLGMEGRDYKKERDVAANVGTVAHARVEAWLRGMDFDVASVEPGLFQAATAGYERFRARWLEERRRPLLLEHKMVSQRFGCGGTLDILSDHEHDPSVDLIDIKTTKANKYWPYDETLVQVSAYAAMAEETTGYVVRNIHIYRIGKELDDEGQFYTLTPKQRGVGTRMFARLCDTYRDLKELRA